jgi:Putative DNA-binding domain
VNLIEVLQRPEGKTLEYKRDLSSPDGLLKTLVAFANTAGGVLAIGVEDGTRRVIGVPDVLAAEERLASIIADSVRPRLVPDIEIVPWRRLQVLVLQVYPSAARPHYLERLGPDTGVFVRLGSTNRRADAAQIEEMRRFGQLGSFDEQPIPELNSEALDFRAASELFAPVRKLTPAALRNLRGYDETPRARGSDCRRIPPFWQGPIWPFPRRVAAGRTLRWEGPRTDLGLKRDPQLLAANRRSGDRVRAEAFEPRSSDCGGAPR